MTDEIVTKWARHWTVCVECLASTSPHHAKGLCFRCYMRKLMRLRKVKKKMPRSKHVRNYKNR